MALSLISIRELFEYGVHFGHHKRRWNPKMEPFIYGIRSGVHIIDLEQTIPLLYKAREAVRDVANKGGRILFVGTKRQAQESIAEAAKRCGQYYINHRWLGGMLTNWKTVSHSIQRLRNLDTYLSQPQTGLTKKEFLRLAHERDKLEYTLGGIKDMGNLPDLLFIIDTNKEEIAVKEANKLGIRVVAVIDSNSNPDGIDLPIPGNDDSIRAIQIYCTLMANAVLEGVQSELTSAGIDLVAIDSAPDTTLPTNESLQVDNPVSETSINLENSQQKEINS